MFGTFRDPLGLHMCICDRWTTQTAVGGIGLGLVYMQHSLQFDLHQIT